MQLFWLVWYWLVVGFVLNGRVDLGGTCVVLAFVHVGFACVLASTFLQAPCMQAISCTPVDCTSTVLRGTSWQHE
jgi:hypothetical protein